MSTYDKNNYEKLENNKSSKMENIRIIKTKRDKDAVYLFGFVYHHKRNNRDGTIYWKCKDCPATITTLDTNVIKIGKKSDFSKDELIGSHEPHETTNIDVLEADQSVKAIRKRVET